MKGVSVMVLTVISAIMENSSSVICPEATPMNASNKENSLVCESKMPASIATRVE